MLDILMEKRWSPGSHASLLCLPSRQRPQQAEDAKQLRVGVGVDVVAGGKRAEEMHVQKRRGGGARHWGGMRVYIYRIMCPVREKRSHSEIVFGVCFAFDASRKSIKRPETKTTTTT